MTRCRLGVIFVRKNEVRVMIDHNEILSMRVVFRVLGEVEGVVYVLWDGAVHGRHGFVI